MEELENEELIDGQEDNSLDKYMTFRIGEDVFGIEIKYVSEIIQMQSVTPIPEVEHFIKGLINLRGKIIPVIDVAERFGKSRKPYNDRTCIIVIGIKGIEVGLIVENIAEVVSIEEGNILPPPSTGHADSEKNRFISGIGKVDGDVKLLLDPVKILSDDSLDFLDKQENEEEE